MISDIALVAVAYGLSFLVQSYGWAWLVCTYVIPLMIANHWLVLITLLQHTHPGECCVRFGLFIESAGRASGYAI